MREMLESTGYPDRALIDDMISGFRTVGDLPATGVFPAKENPATRTMTEVLADARRAQRAVLGARDGSGDDELDSELYRVTLEEQREGWLSEPLSQGELGRMLGPRWVPVRRFGLRQGGKVRPIDDFSEWGVNCLFAAHEKIDLGGVDEVAGIAKWWCRAVGRG